MLLQFRRGKSVTVWVERSWLPYLYRPTISICSNVPNYLSSYFLPIISDSLVALFALCPPVVFVASHHHRYLQQRTVFVIPNLHSASP